MGRMLIQEAPNLDVRLSVMDKNPEAPCAGWAYEFVCADVLNYQAVLSFGEDKDIITVEIENVNIDALEELEKRGKKVFPQPRILRTIQDKGLQKQFFVENSIPTSPYKLCETRVDLISRLHTFPMVQKLRVGGYDGKGVFVIKEENDLKNAFNQPSVLEEMVDIATEISVIVARNESGEIAHFPVVECKFNPNANLVDYLFSPAAVSEAIEEEAVEIAKKTIRAFDLVGIMAVEMFVTKDGKVLVNECAPRPHNSGHHTIECNSTSQFGQHLRAIMNLPLGSTKLNRAGVMINLLGANGYSGEVYYEKLEEVLAIPGVYPHIYGKTETSSYRKMGHITAVGRDIKMAMTRAEEVRKLIQVKSK